MRNVVFIRVELEEGDKPLSDTPLVATFTLMSAHTNTQPMTLSNGKGVEIPVPAGVQKKLPAEGDQAEIDGLLDLVEAIADHVWLKRLPDAPDAAWVGIAHEPVVSSESLEQHRVFTSVLSVT